MGESSREAEYANKQLELEREELRRERQRSHQLTERLHQFHLHPATATTLPSQRVPASASATASAARTPQEHSEDEAHVEVARASRRAYVEGVQSPQMQPSRPPPTPPLLAGYVPATRELSGVCDRTTARWDARCLLTHKRVNHRTAWC